ncbi:MAG: alpha-2-macroglobulin, partial [Bacteroidota bacterium]
CTRHLPVVSRPIVLYGCVALRHCTGVRSMMIEAFHEVGKDLTSVEEQKVWLLQNKRTNDWGSTRATVAACHALLLTGSELLSEPGSISLKVGGENVPIPEDQTAGTGQFQVHWEGSEITPELAEVQIKRKSKSLAFGGMFWQYFEQLDKITPAETPLSLQKSLWKQVNTDRGPELQVISEEAPLKAGDKLTVRIELRVDRSMEYVHLKDMRAAGLEPIEVLSRYRYEGGLGFYQSTKDAATHFFMDRLPKGTYVLEYDLRVSLPGDFSNGITTLQCMYAPEFSSHSAGARIQIVE